MARPGRPDDLGPLEVHLLDLLEATTLPDGGAAADEERAALLRRTWDAQVTSRSLDHAARWLRAEGHGYYTIASAGHEANAMVALALRGDDPALLHYRSGGFYCARALQAGRDPVDDVLRGMLARTTEPMSGGRHKVIGHPDLDVLPQTSTIGSHLPRAVGLAMSMALGAEEVSRWPRDAVVVASIGDASLNHSTVQGALNWAEHAHHRGLPVPLLLVVEDNGLGISVPSPQGWVQRALSARGARDAHVGHDLGALDALRVLRDVVTTVRRRQLPTVLHLETVRYLGHAGSDVELGYRTPTAVREEREHDPLLRTARALVALGLATGDELADDVLTRRRHVRARALELLAEPELEDAEAILAPIHAWRDGSGRRPTVARDGAPAGGVAGRTVAEVCNATLDRALHDDPRLLVFGQDVGAKGGVYGVTKGLQRTHGPRRVFDMLLDESSILGLALGSAVNGYLPVAEVQYLAYLHNAIDQLRGEAATLSFFSDGAERNGMVVRVAAYGYQRGFGGHFHNDDAVASLRDVPGLLVASPSHPDDAGAALEACLAAAASGAVCVLLEPIARYHTRDLHREGDEGWLSTDRGRADDLEPVERVGRARVHGTSYDEAPSPDAHLTIVSWANGLWLSLRAARRLAEEHGVRARVLDLGWVAPLPVADLLADAAVTGRVLVADETRRSGGVGEGVVTALVEGGFRGDLARVASHDSFVPLGRAADRVLLSEDEIVEAARRMLQA